MGGSGSLDHLHQRTVMADGDLSPHSFANAWRGLWQREIWWLEVAGHVSRRKMILTRAAQFSLAGATVLQHFDIAAGPRASSLVVQLQRDSFAAFNFAARVKAPD